MPTVFENPDLRISQPTLGTKWEVHLKRSGQTLIPDDATTIQLGLVWRILRSKAFKRTQSHTRLAEDLMFEALAACAIDPRSESATTFRGMRPEDLALLFAEEATRISSFAGDPYKQPADVSQPPQPASVDPKVLWKQDLPAQVAFDLDSQAHWIAIAISIVLFAIALAATMLLSSRLWQIPPGENIGALAISVAITWFTFPVWIAALRGALARRWLIKN